MFDTFVAPISAIAHSSSLTWARCASPSTSRRRFARESLENSSLLVATSQTAPDSSAIWAMTSYFEYQRVSEVVCADLCIGLKSLDLNRCRACILWAITPIQAPARAVALGAAPTRAVPTMFAACEMQTIEAALGNSTSPPPPSPRRASRAHLLTDAPSHMKMCTFERSIPVLPSPRLPLIA